MDLPAARVLDYTQRRRRWLFLLAAAGLTGYGAYRAYYLPCVVEKRLKLAKLLRALGSISQAFTRSADTISLVSGDLNRFLASDTDEIPNSLRQISKIARSDEFVVALSRASEAVTVGMMRGARLGSTLESKSGTHEGSELADQVLDKVFSPAGTGFVSIVAGSFAKNLVTGFYDSGGVWDPSGERPVPQWVQLICGNEVRQLMGECIQKFVGTAVEVYLNKTMDVNTYDEMFSGLTNPRHGEKMKEVLVSVCSGAVETLVKTSHKVLTSSKPSSSTAAVERIEEEVELPREQVKKDVPGDDSSTGGGGWLNGVSSTLAVPGNRKFVLDVTGRVTFETVKSVLDFMFWKMYDNMRSGMRVVGQEVVWRGMEVIRYLSAKSMLILTVCFSMLLHLAFGSRFLVTA